MSDFVHLHLHSTYSLLDGQCSIAGIVAKAKALGMPAVAVTDHGNLFALKAFYDEARKAGIKPILGVEAYVTSTGDHTLRHEYFQTHKEVKEIRFHLCLHAKNLVGYHNLVRLVSEAYIGGFYKNPRIDHKLLEKYHEGLHCSSACIAGEVAYYLDDGLRGGNDPAKAEEIARWYQSVFGDDYSLEVMIHPTIKQPKVVKDPHTGEIKEQITPDTIVEMKDLLARQKRVAERVIALGKKLGIRVIATNDVHFLEAEDDDSHDVLLAMSTQKKMSDTDRMIYTGQEYFKTADEMRALFPENPEVISATLEVADKITEYNLDSDPIMPKFPIPAEFGDEEMFKAKYDEATLASLYPEGRIEKFGGYEKAIRIQFEAEYLASLVWAGAKRRWGETLSKETVERVQFELDTIRTMGFPGYFLIVNDYIENARRMGVWVGPGRGSAAGAAVAYALGITNVDPLKYDLLFERFLNPDRISMPDIDVDFDDAGRGKVLEFVTNKYGRDHVAHIVTFGQMAPKSVIKDVGRVMGYPLADTNKLASLVPETPKITFKKATNPKDKNGEPNQDYSQGLVDAFNSPDSTVNLLMQRAKRLEGGMRQPGIHACGVIISRDPLTETLPVMPTEGESLLTTQYDGHFVEPVGLLKMDFLGLKTLTVEKECVALLGPNNPRVPEFLRGSDGCLDPDKIPDDDKLTYELFGRGETTGLFQFESDGMKKWLRELQPERLTDLVAMNALYRPGPMDYIPTFVRRKKGEEPIVYDHPLMEKYLKDTYGVCVYQEQVMLLSRLLGKFTRGMSDKLRKAMGKKQIAVMEELKTKFVDGCLSNPEFRIEKWADEAEARKLIDKIWDDWRAFASYAFNKSHAVCYAWIAYQTGYLKAHYPSEFMCAQISSEIGNFDKLPGFVAEAQDMKLDLRLPDVNESGSSFVPTPDFKGIRYGLSGIKGVGAAGEAIVSEREKNGPYVGFLDFCMRLAGTPACNKRVLENLTRTGAFSSLEPNRAKLFNNIEYALKRSQQRMKESASAQANFFDLMAGESGETANDADLADCPAFAPSEDLKNERDFLGVYISGSPIKSCRKAISEISTFKLQLMSDPEALDQLVLESYNDSKEKVDKWKKKSNPFLKDERALRHLDVRVAGILSACTVKLGKPRPDGSPGQNWAILQIDDGTSIKDVDAFCFGKAWEKYNVNGCLEGAVDQLVLICGEVSRRFNYSRDDRVEKKNPEVGEYNFTVREAYVMADSMPLISGGAHIALDLSDPEVKPKASALRDAIAANPGLLPVYFDMRYPDGRIVEVSLGNDLRVASTVSFFTALGKIVPYSAISFRPDSRTTLAPREARPWEA
jgi:DNA polymerase-3 subunit alpha